MNPNCTYEVETHWGWFRLDEGAYQDYLAGKLWITWVPGKREPAASVSTAPANASAKALKLRELAAKSDAYTVCSRFFPKASVEVPYLPKMSDVHIDEMFLPIRAYHCLMRVGAFSFGKVKAIMEKADSLRSIRNLGEKSEKDIKICFLNACYSLLNEYEKAAWWQKVINSSAPDA